MMGSVELTTRAGITQRQLHYWTDRGYLIPHDLDPFVGGGSGHSLEWTNGECEVARLMGLLTSAGVMPAAAHTAARQLAAGRPAQLGSFTLTTTAGAA